MTKKAQKPNVSALAREAGLSPKLVHTRIHKGWTLERALSTPAKKRNAKKKVAKKVATKPVEEPMVTDKRKLEKPSCTFEKTLIFAAALVGFVVGMYVGAM